MKVSCAAERSRVRGLAHELLKECSTLVDFAPILERFEPKKLPPRNFDSAGEMRKWLRRRVVCVRDN